MSDNREWRQSNRTGGVKTSRLPGAGFALLTALAIMSLTGQASAQPGQAGRQAASDNSDQADFQNDAILGMPNQQTPVPQDNEYATAPGAEQRATPTPFTFNIVAPLQYNSNATTANQNGQEALEANPDVRLSYATQLFDSNFRFTGQLRYDGEYFGPPVGNRNVDFLRLNARVQYVNPNNDQDYSPYFAFAPRWSYEPFLSENIANRQDLNVGVQKRFNFDSSFARVPEAARTGSATTWSFGANVFFQQRFNSPLPNSQALIGVLSASYSISDSWSASLASDFTRRWFDEVRGVTRQGFVVEPILTVEYKLPAELFGGNAAAFGNPALDFQASGEQEYSNITRREFSAFYIGAAIKFGYRFGLFGLR
nr:hypothetical protein [uncultured Rhodopila sp.]